MYVLYIWDSIFVNRFTCTILLNSICKWHHMILVSLYQTSLSMTISRIIHVAHIALFFSFEETVIFHCKYEPHILYLFLHWGIFSCFCLLTIVSSATTDFGNHVSFQIMVFSGYMPKSKITISYGTSSFYSFKNLHTVRHNCATELNWYCFPLWLYQSIFSPTMYEASLFSTPSPAFIVCWFFDDGHSDWYELIPHCTFDLYFSNS